MMALVSLTADNTRHEYFDGLLSILVRWSFGTLAFVLLDLVAIAALVVAIRNDKPFPPPLLVGYVLTTIGGLMLITLGLLPSLWATLRLHWAVLRLGRRQALYAVPCTRWRG